MKSKQATTPPSAAAVALEIVFTVEQANRALVLVRRVVRDLVASYAELMRMRTQRQESAVNVGRAGELPQLQSEIDAAVERLNQLHHELTAIGCVLKDWASGLVDFPATYQGRRIWLCWRLGEETVTHWHDTDAGFAGRQPIGPDMT